MKHVRKNVGPATIHIMNKQVIAAAVKVDCVDGLQQEVGFVGKGVTLIATTRIPNRLLDPQPSHLMFTNQAARRAKVKEVGKKGRRVAKSILITTMITTMTMITNMTTTMITIMTMTMCITGKKEKECNDEKKLCSILIYLSHDAILQ